MTWNVLFVYIFLGAVGLVFFYIFVQVLSWLTRFLRELGYQTYYEILLPVYQVVRWVWLLPHHILRFLRVYVLFHWLGSNTFKGTKFVGIKSYELGREGIRKTADFIEFQIDQGKKSYQRKKEGNQENTDKEKEKEEFYKKKQEEREEQQKKEEKKEDSKQQQQDQNKYDEEFFNDLFKRAREKDQKRTAYDVLGVNPSATQEEIKKAYKDLVHKFHPDKFSFTDDEEFKALAEKRFKEITEAYSKLRN